MRRPDRGTLAPYLVIALAILASVWAALQFTSAGLTPVLSRAGS